MKKSLIILFCIVLLIPAAFADNHIEDINSWLNDPNNFNSEEYAQNFRDYIGSISTTQASTILRNPDLPSNVRTEMLTSIRDFPSQQLGILRSLTVDSTGAPTTEHYPVIDSVLLSSPNVRADIFLLPHINLNGLRGSFSAFAAETLGIAEIEAASNAGFTNLVLGRENGNWFLRNADMTMTQSFIGGRGIRVFENSLEIITEEGETFRATGDGTLTVNEEGAVVLRGNERPQLHVPRSELDVSALVAGDDSGTSRLEIGSTTVSEGRSVVFSIADGARCSEGQCAQVFLGIEPELARDFPVRFQDGELVLVDQRREIQYSLDQGNGGRTSMMVSSETIVDGEISVVRIDNRIGETRVRKQNLDGSLVDAGVNTVWMHEDSNYLNGYDHVEEVSVETVFNVVVQGSTPEHTTNDGRLLDTVARIDLTDKLGYIYFEEPQLVPRSEVREAGVLSFMSSLFEANAAEEELAVQKTTLERFRGLQQRLPELTETVDGTVRYRDRLNSAIILFRNDAEAPKMFAGEFRTDGSTDPLAITYATYTDGQAVSQTRTAILNSVLEMDTKLEGESYEVNPKAHLFLPETGQRSDRVFAMYDTSNYNTGLTRGADGKFYETLDITRFQGAPTPVQYERVSEFDEDGRFSGYRLEQVSGRVSIEGTDMLNEKIIQAGRLSAEEDPEYIVGRDFLANTQVAGIQPIEVTYGLGEQTADIGDVGIGTDIVIRYEDAADGSDESTISEVLIFNEGDAAIFRGEASVDRSLTQSIASIGVAYLVGGQQDLTITPESGEFTYNGVEITDSTISLSLDGTKEIWSARIKGEIDAAVTTPVGRLEAGSIDLVIARNYDQEVTDVSIESEARLVNTDGTIDVVVSAASLISDIDTTRSFDIQGVGGRVEGSAELALPKHPFGDTVFNSLNFEIASAEGDLGAAINLGNVVIRDDCDIGTCIDGESASFERLVDGERASLFELERFSLNTITPSGYEVEFRELNSEELHLVTNGLELAARNVKTQAELEFRDGVTVAAITGVKPGLEVSGTITKDGETLALVLSDLQDPRFTAMLGEGETTLIGKAGGAQAQIGDVFFDASDGVVFSGYVTEDVTDLRASAGRLGATTSPELAAIALAPELAPIDFGGRPWLKYGDIDRNEDGAIWEAQRRLKALGYNLGSTGPGGDGIDGEYGPTMTRIVRDFQRSQGLPTDGVLGELTEQALRNAQPALVAQTEDGIIAEINEPTLYYIANPNSREVGIEGRDVIFRDAARALDVSAQVIDVGVEVSSFESFEDKLEDITGVFGSGPRVERTMVSAGALIADVTETSNGFEWGVEANNLVAYDVLPNGQRAELIRIHSDISAFEPAVLSGEVRGSTLLFDKIRAAASRNGELALVDLEGATADSIRGTVTFGDTTVNARNLGLSVNDGNVRAVGSLSSTFFGDSESSGNVDLTYAISSGAARFQGDLQVTPDVVSTFRGNRVPGGELTVESTITVSSDDLRGSIPVTFLRDESGTLYATASEINNGFVFLNKDGIYEEARLEVDSVRVELTSFNVEDPMIDQLIRNVLPGAYLRVHLPERDQRLTFQTNVQGDSFVDGEEEFWVGWLGRSAVGTENVIAFVNDAMTDQNPEESGPRSTAVYDDSLFDRGPRSK